jgi:hypothetical protein
MSARCTGCLSPSHGDYCATCLAWADFGASIERFVKFGREQRREPVEVILSRMQRHLARIDERIGEVEGNVEAGT